MRKTLSFDDVPHYTDAQKNLHIKGWTVLDRLPEYELFAMVEEYHAKWEKPIMEMLAAREQQWGDPGQISGRIGAGVAEEVSALLKGEGIYVSCTHQSEDQKTYQKTGPRWYVSIMEAAINKYRETGGPHMPDEMMEIMWPRDIDREAPWITELGWTCVPPSQNPQELHADIMTEDNPVPFDRIPGVGRFHHCAWKADHVSNCTTEVVSYSFVEGRSSGKLYKKLRSVAAPCVVIDSEMSHRGGQSAPRWTSTCTAQISSTTGWPALHCGDRAHEELMRYTLGLRHRPPAELLPGYHVPATDGGPQWLQGARVMGLFEGRWHPAVVEGQNPDGTYRIIWDEYFGVWALDQPASQIRSRFDSTKGVKGT